MHKNSNVHPSQCLAKPYAYGSHHACEVLTNTTVIEWFIEMMQLADQQQSTAQQGVSTLHTS
jgi:hypothetical protein